MPVELQQFKNVDRPYTKLLRLKDEGEGVAIDSAFGLKASRLSPSRLGLRIFAPLSTPIIPDWLKGERKNADAIDRENDQSITHFMLRLNQTIGEDTGDPTSRPAIYVGSDYKIIIIGSYATEITLVLMSRDLIRTAAPYMGDLKGI